jgi:hypothetical protein
MACEPALRHNIAMGIALGVATAFDVPLCCGRRSVPNQVLYRSERATSRNDLLAKLATNVRRLLCQLAPLGPTIFVHKTGRRRSVPTQAQAQPPFRARSGTLRGLLELLGWKRADREC